MLKHATVSGMASYRATFIQKTLVARKVCQNLPLHSKQSRKAMFT